MAPPTFAALTNRPAGPPGQAGDTPEEAGATESAGDETPSPLPLPTRVADALRRRRAWADRLLPLALGLVALAVYVRSLLPGTGYSGDTAKWQFLGVVGGVPHATGYPLYVALDQAFVGLVPWGSPAWRANLLSAVLGAGAVVVLYLLLRVLRLRPAVAAATALTFGFTTTFWSQAVVAEVYTLEILLLVSVTACLAHWRRGAANPWLLLGSGLYLVSLGHHATAVLALPGVAWLVGADWRRALTRRNVVALVLMGLVAASQYLYLLYMSDVGGYVEHPIDGFGDVVHYLSGGSFRNDLFTFGPGEIVDDRLPLLRQFLWDELWLMLLPAALGLWCGLRSHDRPRRDVAVHLTLLGGFTAVFALNFDVPDVIVFCLPLFLALTVFVGLGLDATITWLAARRAEDPRWAARLGVAAALGLVVLPLGVGVVGYRRSSQRTVHADADRMERLMSAADRHAVIVTDGYGDSMYVMYYLLGEGLADTHDLALAHLVTPGNVVDYLEGRPGPVALAADDVDVASGEVRPTLYTATPHQALQLTEAGVELTEVVPQVWRIDGLGRA